ncbi:MAG: glycosyltransferase [Pseudomonadales bacterium]|nr:glycosyltransferase [Pseudomonadales bacterium]
MKIVLVTNIPAPYRETIHAIVSKHFKQNYTVIYCDERETNRVWRFNKGNYNSITLKKSTLTYKDRYIHVNPEIWSKLSKINPDVVITMGGFNPTLLMAFFWSKLKRKKHIPMTDGWLKSEEDLSQVHYWIRKLVYQYSDAYIGASKHSLNLYRSYHCEEKSLFQSYLCADNERFYNNDFSERKYDLLFSGQFIERKMPLFFVEVAKIIRQKKGNCSALILGSGPQEKHFMEALKIAEIDVEYPGFASQDQLPGYYSSAKLYLFPTKQDPWGVVANEACAAGTPVITCEYAGAANDLIQNGINGFILPLDAQVWADKCIELLDNQNLHRKMSINARESVKPFNFQDAALGIINAINYAVRHRTSSQNDNN